MTAVMRGAEGDQAMNSSTTSAEVYDIKPVTVTVALARRLTGLGATTIWKLIKEETLETVHVGRRRLITFRSLEALLTPASLIPRTRRRRQPRKPQATEARA
jgi:hypothetical protein